MIDENENVGIEGTETQDTSANVETTTTADEGNTTEKSEEVQTSTTGYTQEQINDIVRDRLNRDRTSLYARYGVQDKTGLDELVGKALSYDVIKERYDKIKEEKQNITNELALTRQNINPERKDDIFAYFKGKGLEFNEEALQQELSTHPEWLKVVEKDNTPKTTLSYVSANRGDIVESSEKEQAMKLFGIGKL